MQRRFAIVPMNWAPQIRLRTIFLLFFCAAVGLATYPDLLGALSPAIATAMGIGLVQQTRSLLAWQPDNVPNCDELTFARRFAIVWRIVLATTIAACLFVEMLLAKGLIEIPEREAILLIESFTLGILPFCMIIVLCNSMVRWRLASHANTRHPARLVLFLLFATLIALIMLVEGTTVDFLVHRAIAGIEAAQPKRFQRTGVYPNLADEGYRSLWLAFGSILCLLAAGATTARLRARPNSGRGATWLKLLTVLLFLIPPSIFCYWYYSGEFHRLSPEMAGAGLALIWWDWLAGALVATILVTAAAYRIGKTESVIATVDADLARDTDRHAFHESFPCLLLLAANAIYALAVLVIEMLQYDSFLGVPTVGRYISMFCYPTTLLTLATCVASLQLCWTRWKSRHQTVPWEIAGLSPLAFFQGWFVLALILVAAIPTLRGFAFILWLGPIDLLPLLGL